MSSGQKARALLLAASLETANERQNVKKKQSATVYLIGLAWTSLGVAETRDEAPSHVTMAKFSNACILGT